MYQYALIKMLHNTKQDTYHPIFYYDSPLPGNAGEGSLMRYKSKGHHSTGFKERDEAIASANVLHKKLVEEHHDTVLVELDKKDDIIWNDDEIPADTQLRPWPKIVDEPS